jgi:hypothetical protein
MANLLRWPPYTPVEAGYRLEAYATLLFGVSRLLLCFHPTLGSLNHGRQVLRWPPCTPMGAGYRLEAYATLLFGPSRCWAYEKDR